MNRKPIQHYNDEYDRLTVRMCRQREQKHKRHLEEGNAPHERIWHELLFQLLMFYDVEMYAGERWENKKKAVDEMMARDRTRDTLLATSEAPEPVHCLTCRAQMKVIGKEIDETSVDEGERVLFFYECPNRCKPRRAFFNTGEELRPKVRVCPKCRREMTANIVREKSEVVMTDTCTSCGHVDTTRFSTVVETPVPDPDFMKDYQRFCLTDEQGAAYLKTKAHQDWSLQQGKEQERDREKRELADKLSKIQKLNITEVEQLLSASLAKEQYERLHLSAPEIRKVFTVPFTIQNLNESRPEREAISELEKLIQALLAPTNWRLMSDGIHGQLGVLSGRLRGYDKEYELVELVEKLAKKSAKSDKLPILRNEKAKSSQTM